jgi:hypothetical protein
MAAYHKVEVSLNANAVEVGIPSPQTVNVTVPTVGPVGPQGPAGPKGDPGEVSGSIAWDSVTDKPSTFPPSSHTHVAADITDFTSAVEAVSPPADWDTLANKPASFTPSAHGSTHHTGGADAIAPNQISAAWAQVLSTQGISGDTVLTAGRNRRIGLASGSAVTANITLPFADNQAGDIITLVGASVGPPFASTYTIRLAGAFDGGGNPVGYTNLATINALGQGFTFVSTGTASGWSLRAVDTHEQPASTVTGLATVATTGDYDDLSDKPTIPTASSATPQALGTAAAGSSNDFARADHVHAMPSASDVGLGSEDSPTFAGLTVTALGGGGTQVIFADDDGTVQKVDQDTARDSIGLGTADAVQFESVTVTDLFTSGFEATGTGGNLLRVFGDGLEFVGTSAATTRTNLGLGDAATANIGAAAGEIAEGNHVHGNLTSDGKLGSTSGLPLVTTTAGAVTTLALGTAGQVLQVNSGATGVEFAAASGGDTVSITSSAADVLSVSSGAISADDGGTIDSADPFIKWDDTAGKLVYANPLSRPSGALYVGLAPTTTALGSNAVNIQSARSAATSVASGAQSVAIGNNSTTSGGDSVAVGKSAFASSDATAVGSDANANASQCTAIGRGAGFSGRATGSTFVGRNAWCSGVNGVALGNFIGDSLRAGFFVAPFSAVYWGGQTTTNAATILNLDGTATNRFTIAASTALAVDILLVARRSDTQDKWLVARRFLGIRRDGSNNTSLIGSVQTLGTDQSEGSPTWSFTLTADDTNEALQLEVTGAASETVQWRATAFYRVV